MEELIVDGITPEDFDTLKLILETYPVSINGDITYEKVFTLHSKVSQIVEALRSE